MLDNKVKTLQLKSSESDARRLSSLSLFLSHGRNLYHMPDYPDVLQTYVWQELDMSPEFPRLRKFLNFWEKNLDGKIHAVTVSSFDEYYEFEIRYTPKGFEIH
jgi:uncharacterized protein Usg